MSPPPRAPRPPPSEPLAAAGGYAARAGVLGCIRPFVSFVGSPVWGAVADRTWMHREVFAFVSVASVLFRSMLPLVPRNVAVYAVLVAMGEFTGSGARPRPRATPSSSRLGPAVLCWARS